MTSQLWGALPVLALGVCGTKSPAFCATAADRGPAPELRSAATRTNG